MPAPATVSLANGEYRLPPLISKPPRRGCETAADGAEQVRLCDISTSRRGHRHCCLIPFDHWRGNNNKEAMR